MSDQPARPDGVATAPAADTSVSTMPRDLLPLLTGLIFVVMMDGRVISTVLPQVAADFGTTVAAAAVALTAYALPYGICQLAYGPLADRRGAMRVIAIATIVFAVVVALGAFAPTLPAFIGTRLLAGAVAAAFFPLALATVGNLVPYAERQGAIAMLLAALAAGMVMGAAIGGLMAQVVSWRWMFILDSLLVVALIVPVWRARHATPPAARAPGAPFAAHRALLASRTALVTFAVVFVEGLVYFGAFGYLGAMLRERDGLPYLAVGLLLALDGVATLIVSRYVGRLRARFSETWMLRTGGLLAAGGFLLALMLPDWRAMAVAVVAMGAGFPIFHSTLQTRATELNPAARGTAISLFAFSLFMGSGVGTLLSSGVLALLGSYQPILLTAAVGMALLALVSPRLTRLRPA